MKISISILLLIGIACLWFFGKTQPIVVIEQTISVDRPISCPACQGRGSDSCPKCAGSGSIITGKKFRRAQCAQCKGKGKLICPKCRGAGRVTAPELQKTKIVKADLSLLEKILAGFRVAPGKNCRPQRKLDGSYPLIAKYIETTTGPAYNARVVKWDSARFAGNEWIVQAVLEFKDKNGRPVREGREFIVANREVKGIRKTE
ncbi:MAG: hypothetical protein Q7J98_02700 [Kiritimatiellia bacterium]|nr:hypothetical protein [Kiritimatiellia bacterium]